MLATFQNSVIDRDLEELTPWLLPHLVSTISFTVALAPWISKQWQELSSKAPLLPLFHTNKHIRLGDRGSSELPIDTSFCICRVPVPGNNTAYRTTKSCMGSQRAWAGVPS